MINPIQVHSNHHRQQVDRFLSQQETLRQIQAGQVESQSSGFQQVAGKIRQAIYDVVRTLHSTPHFAPQTDLQNTYEQN